MSSLGKRFAGGPALFEWALFVACVGRPFGLRVIAHGGRCCDARRMTSYIVSYDLKAPGKDYATLIEYLKSHTNWWHNLGSTWVVVTDLSAVELRDGIKSHTDSNDKVLVVQSAGIGAWFSFAESGSNWLKKNL